MNNPKLNMLIRFTLEIFLVFLLVSGINSRSAGTTPAKAPRDERTGERPGSGVDAARLTLNAGSQGAIVRLRELELPLSDPATLRAMSETKPDQIVITLIGSPAWQGLLSFALENDLPVSLEIAH